MGSLPQPPVILENYSRAPEGENFSLFGKRGLLHAKTEDEKEGNSHQ